MTLEQFNKLKENTRKSLERKLTLSKKPGATPYPVVTERVTEKFQLISDASSDEVMSLMKEVIAFATHTKGNISHQIFETNTGRVGYYSHTNYYVKYDKVVDEITDEIIKKSVHKALKSIMKLRTFDYIDCGIMQLFKDGKIDWETVVNSHKNVCTL